MIKPICCILILYLEIIFCENYQYDKVCQGTSNELSVNRYLNSYEFLQTFYNNCQIIEGNLELVSVGNIPEGSNFEFLISIKEIAGYLLIFDLQVEKLPFPNLRLIRGESTFKNNCLNCAGYSLIVENSKELKELLMPNLTEISKGDVIFKNNSNLCFVDSIDWESIFNYNHFKAIITKTGSDKCEKCASKCRIPKTDKKRCWSRSNCQQITRKCPQLKGQCNNRCNGSLCCNDECSAGCYGNTASNCYACKNVNNDGKCLPDCPAMWRLNPENKNYERNPDWRVNHAKQCKLECPAHMVQYDSHCINRCPEKNFNKDFEGICVPCSDHCPKKCNGTKDDWLNSENIKQFEGCQSVVGNIRILDASFKQNKNVTALTPADLQILSTVIEIEDYLVVNANEETLTDLAFLKNLKVIQGRELYKGNSFLVMDNYLLRQLNLKSLARISRGNVLMHSNPNLCYANSFNWTSLFKSDSQQSIIDNKTVNLTCDGELCDEACDSNGCMGPGNDHCFACLKYRYKDSCMVTCGGIKHPIYAATPTQCRDCHHQCESGCSGPSRNDCFKCLNYNYNSTCVEICPHNMLPDENNICQKSMKSAIISGVVSGTILLVVLLVFAICCIRRQTARVNMKKVKLQAKLDQVEVEPLVPGRTAPDVSKMIIVGEESLKRGPVIGSGAFGTVYKGYWVPENEKFKIPVAIKVLNENNQKAQCELLEEARIMATVSDDFCVRILAICVSKNLQLVTRLMPLGCLQDYVSDNRNHIGSKALLEWCCQIAKGMNYLERVNIIHRDLAARNVLVQSPCHVRITDFGLSKMIPETTEYLEEGGKLPIKWLALESIRERIFTHKSDVWSFGITIWELFTFGARPYVGKNVHEVIVLLEKGERLPQPEICTIDVYMLMIRCWLVDAASRPSFANLVDEFSKMARDPGRFLVIPNDELMRLPMQAAENPRDLLRNISLGSNPDENVIDADAYLEQRYRQMLNPLMEEDAAAADDDAVAASTPPAQESFRNSRRRKKPLASLTLLANPLHEDSQIRYTPSPSHAKTLATPSATTQRNRTMTGFKRPEYDVPKNIDYTYPNLDGDNYLQSKDSYYLQIIDDDQRDDEDDQRVDEDDKSTADKINIKSENSSSSDIRIAENPEYFSDIL